MKLFEKIFSKKKDDEIRNLQKEVTDLKNMICGLYGESSLIKDSLKFISMNSNSIFSYCLNEAIMNQSSTNFIQSSRYNYFKRLHELIRPHKISESAFETKRYGGINDGGYLMVSPFSQTKIAYSLGISTDVTWDKAMADFGYEIYMYDHTIDSLPEVNPKFHWKKIGLTGGEETDCMKHLETLICQNGHEEKTGMVLKMDIEGWEWDLLANIKPKILSQFDQIMIELHDLNKLSDAEKHIQALENLTKNHDVVHIHANNYRYATFSGKLITPNVLELTLVKKSVFPTTETSSYIYEDLNTPNNPASHEIFLGEWYL